MSDEKVVIVQDVSLLERSKSTIVRALRAGMSTIVALLLPHIGALATVLPEPYNVTLIPILMAIGKFLRDTYNPTNAPGHWANKIPF